jgi:hypothetical protein
MAYEVFAGIMFAWAFIQIGNCTNEEFYSAIDDLKEWITMIFYISCFLFIFIGIPFLLYLKLA